MSRENWDNQSIVDGWGLANGSDAWPYGDNWRLALINPVVFHVASLVQAGFIPKTRDSLYRGIAEQRNGLVARTAEQMKSALQAWHENPVLERNSGNAGAQIHERLNKVKIVDFGCGEAYRSRWLARFGVGYLGLDVEKQCRVAGDRKAATLEKPALSADAKAALSAHDYKTCDLESDEFKFDDFAPNLGVAINSLDHIPNPRPVLARIAERFPTAPLLAITLNPRHFKLEVHPADTLHDGSNQHFGKKHSAAIESVRIRSNGDPAYSVDVFFRSLRDWEEAFSDKFNIIATSPLQFSYNTILNYSDENISYSAPAFHVWLLYPKKAGRKVQLHDQQLLRSLFASASEVVNLTEDAQNISGKMFSELSQDERNRIFSLLVSFATIHEFDAGERLLYRDNLGGDVWVVFGGSVQLGASDGTVLQTFEPGDIIGELETERVFQTSDSAAKDRTRKYMFRRYAFDVDAGPEGARLLQIPSETFRAALMGNTVLASALFQTLRDKMLLHIFRYVHVPMADTGLNVWRAGNVMGGKQNTPALLQAVARGLMYCASREADDASRDTDGCTIFIGCAELASLLRENDRSVAGALELFHRLGMIRWFKEPVLDLIQSTYGHNIQNPETGAEKRLRSWRRMAFEFLVARPLSNAKEPTKLLDLFDQNYFFTRSEWRKELFENPRADTKLTNTGRECRAAFRTFLTNNSIENRDAAERIGRWLANIGYVDVFILRGMGCGSVNNAHVIRVVAPHELRRLALDGNEFNRIFVDRFRSFPQKPTSTEALAFDNHARLESDQKKRYCEIIEAFLKSAWQGDGTGGDCHMTAWDEIADEGWKGVRAYKSIASAT